MEDLLIALIGWIVSAVVTAILVGLLWVVLSLLGVVLAPLTWVVIAAVLGLIVSTIGVGLALS